MNYKNQLLKSRTMKFKKIEFKDKNAQRVYDNYINSLRNVLNPILDSDRQEVLMEFNSHSSFYITYENEGEEFPIFFDRRGLKWKITQIEFPESLFEDLK